MSEAAPLATAPSTALSIPGLARFGGQRALLPIIVIAAGLALIAGIWLYGRAPDYKVLFSNVNDRDGGEIIAVLQQMNVPYKFADGSGAILVPAERVHETRLRLASQGLPKGGSVGFELMENQKLGLSQFAEQVNYQRSLEGELARSIQSISSVQSARVHLALAKDSVFVRDRQQPSASVLLNLYPGRSLEPGQVNAVVHLVSASIPNLPADNVTVLDQNGDLLSKQPGQKDDGLDPNQLKYQRDYQTMVAQRIESILAPIVGKDNVRAEVTADVDFSRLEQAAEIYSPNQTPNQAAVRSQQTSSSSGPAAGAVGGVPGALSNQPTPTASAPVVQPPGQAQAAAATPAPAGNQSSEATTNYEVDKTVRYTQQPMGGIKRVTAAVVVNYRRSIDAKGKEIWKPLAAAELSQIQNLVKEAMGYSQQRGDTLNVVNSRFSNDVVVEPALPVWKDPEYLDMALLAGKYLLLVVSSLLVYGKLVRPMLKRLDEATALKKEAEKLEEIETDEDGNEIESQHRRLPAMTHEQKLMTARSMAHQDPKAVASVLKTWVNGNG